VSKCYDYDVIIVGGGMVGTASACALSQLGLSVAIIDIKSAQTQWQQDTIDMRVSAITLASQRILKRLNAWPLILEKRANAYEHMHVWDASGSGYIHFDCADIGEPCLGHIIENNVVISSLWQIIQQQTIDIFAPAQIETIHFHHHQVEILLQYNQNTLNLTSKLIIAADGAQSLLRQQASIEVTAWSYHQHALVCTVKTSESHQQTAWQRFLSSGPLAFLPLQENYCSIVWSTSPEQANQLKHASDEQFLLELNSAIAESPLGEVNQTSSRGVFPLQRQHAQSYIAQRMVLVGDAAHTIHPLAGQGVNLGFLDVASLTQVISQALEQNKDIGAQHILRRYERARKGDNLLMMSSMDAFKWLFSNNNPSLSLLRNSGLKLSNQLPGVKNYFMQQAMGANRNLPPLAQAIY